MFFGQGECFASSIAEASGIGVPTIALATPLRDNGQAEQIFDDVTGYLVGDIGQAVFQTRRLMTRPPNLQAMKQAALEHCHSRWSAHRAASDLISLYEYWRDPSVRPPYADMMLRETEVFAASYRTRIAHTMSQNLFGRFKWRTLLWAAENGQLFKLGRAVRRIRHWKTYRHLPKE
jgi:hypothetical protein